MKKILTIALVALLATASVFADFTGSATLGLGYNFEDKSYGFSNDSEVKVTYELTTGAYPTEETPALEGNVIAGIKASFALSIKDYKTTAEGAPTWNLKPEISEAYVAGTDWKVSILGAQASQDFASSAIDKYAKDGALNATTVAVGVVAAPGFTAEYKGWKMSAGFANGKKDTTTVPAKYNYYVVLNGVGTPKLDMTEDEFDNWAKALGDTDVYTVVAKQLKDEATVSSENYLDYSATVATPDFAFGDVKVTLGAAVGDATAKTANLGFSGKVAYDTDDIKASVASDLVLAGIGDEVKADADVALKASYKSIALDAYYATKVATQSVITPNKKAANKTVENLLSVKLAADLKDFGAPVSVAVYGKDLINEKVLGASAKLTLENSLNASASFDYDLTAEDYAIAGSVGYTVDIFDLAAGATFKYTKASDAKQLYANASVETSKLIPGATLKLAYGPVSDANGNATSNLLKEKYGKVDASCTIAF